MAFSQNFSVTQVFGNNSVIYFADTSTGSDGAITGRRIYITNSQGQYITAGGVTSTTPTYTSWALANTTTTVDCLLYDQAWYIRVDWINVSGTVLYTKTTLYGLYPYTQTFLLQLTKNQIPDPSILQDTNYFANKSKLHTLLKDADNAVVVGGDIYSAQNSLNAATYMMANSNDYF